MGAGNFHPDYVKINRNGTIPSLTASGLIDPLIESSEILVYLNKHRPEGFNLEPKHEATSRVMTQLTELVHSPDLDTNIVLLMARDSDELSARKNTFKSFLGLRQHVLEDNCKQFPDNDFYKDRRDMNGSLYRHYLSADDHSAFFHKSHEDYRGFAAGMNRMESLIALPYAAGSEVTYADLHMVAWTAHALAGAGAQCLDDFHRLEKLIRKTVPNFKIGEKTKQWWGNMMKRESFKKIYPHLH